MIMPNEWLEKTKERIEAARKKIENSKYRVETAEEVAMAAHEGILRYEELRKRVDAERGEVRKAEIEAEKVIVYLEEKFGLVRQQYEEMQRGLEKGKDYQAMFEGTMEKVEKKLKKYREEDSPDLVHIKTGLASAREVSDSGDHEKAYQIAQEAHKMLKGLDERAAVEALPNISNVFGLPYEPKEKTEFEIVEEPAVPTNSDIAKLLGKFATAEREGKDITKARDYANKALHSEGKERAKYFKDAQEAYRYLEAAEVPEPEAEKGIELKLSVEKAEPEKTPKPPAKEVPKRYEIEDDIIHVSDIEAVAEVCAALAQKRGLDARAESCTVFVSYDKHQENEVKKLQEGFKEMTSGAWRFELEKDEYEALMGAGGPARKLLEELENRNLITRPDLMWTGYRLEPIPKVVAEYLREEAQRLKGAPKARPPLRYPEAPVERPVEPGVEIPAKEEAPKRYDVEDAIIFSAENDAVAEACAAVAREKGLDAKAERGEVLVSYDEHQEKDIETLKKRFYKTTSASRLFCKELTEKEYNRLIKTGCDNPFGNLLRKLETENKVVPPYPGWLTNYKLKAEIPLAVYERMKEEVRKLEEKAEEAGEIEPSIEEGRLWIDFPDEPLAAFVRSITEARVTGAKCEIRAMEEGGHKVITTYEPGEEKAVRELYETFRSKDRVTVIIPTDVYKELMNREEGVEMRNYLESEEGKGNLKKRRFFDSYKLSGALPGVASELETEISLLKGKIKTLGPTRAREKLDKVEVKRKMEKRMKAKEKMRGKKIDWREKPAEEPTKKPPKKPAKKKKAKKPVPKRAPKKGYPRRPDKKKVAKKPVAKKAGKKKKGRKKSVHKE